MIGEIFCVEGSKKNIELNLLVLIPLLYFTLNLTGFALWYRSWS